MKHCGIIFDCDGTLVNSLNQALESFNYALAQVGDKTYTPEQIKQYYGAGADRILARVLDDEEKGRAAFEHYLQHQSELAGHTQLHNGVREMLEALKDRGVPMAVVTGRHARDLEVVLAPHDISDYFVTLIADNHAPNSKPAPDGVLLAAQRMALKAECTFYVGDAVYDIQAAGAAGSVPIAALWDALAETAELKAAGAEFLASTPGDILPYFQRRFSL